MSSEKLLFPPEALLGTVVLHYDGLRNTNGAEKPVRGGEERLFEAEVEAAQTELELRLDRLRAERGGLPVYALEHGLDPQRIALLRRHVGGVLRREGISDWWTNRSLPLVVLATETGYGYRGTGTDFWPVLSADLQADLTERDRGALSDLFRAAHGRHGLKAPASTDWNRLFRHIAWPIANAIAPIEIHRGLAESLYRVFRRPPDRFESSDLAVALRRAAGLGSSRRLTQWLQDDQLAGSLAARLLDLPDDGRLSREVVDRIWADLSRDAPSRRAVGRALAEHRRLQGGRPVAKPGRAELALRAHGSSWTLVLAPPTFAPIHRDRLVRAAQGRSARLWALSDPIDLQMLCEGRSFALSLRKAPSRTDLFLGTAGGLEDADPQMISELGALAPDLSVPLLFPERGGAAPQADAIRPAFSRKWRFIPERDSARPDDLSVVGQLGEDVIVEIDTLSAEHLTWAKTQGLKVETDARLELLSEPLARHSPAGPILPVGLPAAFRLTSRGEAILSAGAGGTQSVTLSEEKPILLVTDDAPGEHVLETRGLGGAERLGWRRTQQAVVAPPLELSLDGDDLTIEALLEGALALRLRVHPGTTAPPLRVSIMVADEILAAVALRPEGSVIVSGLSGLAPLTEALQAEQKPARLELVAELEKAGRYSWTLGRRLQAVAWERGEDGWACWQDEVRLDCLRFPASDPLRSVSQTTDGADITLLIPIGEDGRPLDAEGLVVGPERLSLGAAGHKPVVPTFTRQWREERDDGLASASDAWLRWSCASSPHAVLEIGRAPARAVAENAVVEQMCGRAWRGAEAEALRFAGSFWSALAEVCIQDGLAAGEGFPDLPPEARSSLRQCLENRFRTAAPQVRRGGRGDIEAAAVLLDDAVNEAWEDHFQALHALTGVFPLGDCDAYNDEAAWIEAIEKARSLNQLGSLKAMVLPDARGRALADFIYAEATPADIGLLLNDVHVDVRRRGRLVTEEDLRRGLLFWTDPRSFLLEDQGRETLKRLLADRQSARAIRYAAVRYAVSRGRFGRAR